MKRVAKYAAGTGCLMSLLGPLLAVLLYPKANWLFALVVMGIAILLLVGLFHKDPTPQALADDIEKILTGP